MDIYNIEVWWRHTLCEWTFARLGSVPLKWSLPNVLTSLSCLLSESNLTWYAIISTFGKEPPANAGVIRDVGLIPGSGRSPGEGNGNPLQDSCLENPMVREVWWDQDHRVRHHLKWLRMQACIHWAAPNSSVKSHVTVRFPIVAVCIIKGRESEGGGFLMAQLVKNPPAMQETWVQSLGREDPLEKGKATHSSITAWRILWTV